MIWTLLFLQLLWQAPHNSDFGAFYRSGVAWQANLPAYQDARPNLNPPWVTALLFAPLARLPIAVALAIWLALNALAIGGSLWLIGRELHFTPRQQLAVFLCLALSYAWMLEWWQGQITGLLMYLATRAWLAARHDRPVVAGAWLAVVVAVKPSLALVAIPLGLVTLTAAAVSSAAITCAGVVLTGVQPWREWLTAGQGISWYSHSPNGSLIGVLARLHGLGGRDFARLSETMPASWWLAWGVLAWILLVLSLKARSVDTRWATGFLVAILVFPLGWIYYLPLALGPLVASVRWNGWLTRAAVLALALQLPLLPLVGNAGPGFILIASFGCLGTALLWLAVVPWHLTLGSSSGID